MTTTKQVSYRGGIVTFSLPTHWREEYEPSGGGTFYEERPDSGTLRLSVVSLESKAETAQEMARGVFPAGSHELLPGGLPMRKSVKGGWERFKRLKIYTWEVAVPVEPRRLRLVIFQHTILAKREADPATAAEIALIDQSVRGAQFSLEPGVAGASGAGGFVDPQRR